MLSNAGKTFSYFNTLLHIFAQGLFWARNQNNHQNFDLFLLPNGDVKKRERKKWLTQKKKQSFSKPPSLNIFSPELQGLVLECKGIINTKGINLSQPIWSSDCPT